MTNKIIKTSNRKCREFVKKLQAFNANNLDGNDYENCYVVWSYDWYPLFVFDKTCGGCWYGNNDRYSKTTSKHYTQSHPHSDGMAYYSHEQLNKLISKLQNYKRK